MVVLEGKFRYVDGSRNGDAPCVLVAEGRDLVRLGISAMLSSLGAPPRQRFASTLAEVEAALVSPTPIDGVVASAELYQRMTGCCGKPVTPSQRVIVVASTATCEAHGSRHVASASCHLVDELTVEALQEALGGIVAHAGERQRAASLTPRETEVLDLLVVGMSNKHIARRLGISIHGVKRHVSSILAKFNSDSRSQVLARVLRDEAWTGLAPTP